MKKGTESLEKKFDLKRLMSNVITTTSINVSEVAIKEPSAFFWGEVDAPLDLREKNK